MIPSSSSGLTTLKVPFSQEPLDNQLNYHHPVEIRAYGCCYDISVNGDIALGEGRNAHLYGNLNATISIRNEPPIPPRLLGAFLPYVLVIKNIDTGQIRTKMFLSYYVYLYNFTGFGFIDDYYKAWGPTRALFFLHGFADYY